MNSWFFRVRERLPLEIRRMTSVSLFLFSITSPCLSVLLRLEILLVAVGVHEIGQLLRLLVHLELKLQYNHHPISLLETPCNLDYLKEPPLIFWRLVYEPGLALYVLVLSRDRPADGRVDL
jgi:hypothetical protein